MVEESHPANAGRGLLSRVPEMHGAMLLYWGGLDQHIPKAETLAVADALKNAKKTYVAD
jgi:hypothetical protein